MDGEIRPSGKKSFAFDIWPIDVRSFDVGHCGIQNHTGHSIILSSMLRRTRIPEVFGSKSSFLI